MLAILTSLCLITPLDGQTEKKVYEVQLYLYQAETLNGLKKETKVISSPTLSTLSGRPSRFIVGGENRIPHTNPVKHEPVGTMVTVIISHMSADACFVQLSAEDNAVRVQNDDLLVQSGSQFKLSGKIELNKKMSFRMAGSEDGKQTWVDFTITEHKP